MADFKPGELVYLWRRPHYRLAIIVGPAAAMMESPAGSYKWIPHERWHVLVDGHTLTYGAVSLHKSEGFNPVAQRITLEEQLDEKANNP